MMITGDHMKQELGEKLGILYKRNWPIFFGSLILLLLGFSFFQLHSFLFSLFGMLLFSTGFYYLIELFFTYIIVYENGFCLHQLFSKPQIYYFHEIDLLEEEKRKSQFLWHTKFHTYYHFMKAPFQTLLTLSKTDFFDLSFLLEKVEKEPFQIEESSL